VKARTVPRLDPAAPLARGAGLLVRMRLDELCGFMPAAGDPAAVTALHDMRIAAKRLRYALELTSCCFGPYAATAVKRLKALQEVLGEIHDCDVQLPEAAALLDELTAADVAAVAEGRPAPHATAYAGLVAVQVQMRARREQAFARFAAMWEELERKGFRARLEHAIIDGER